MGGGGVRQGQWLNATDLLRLVRRRAAQACDLCVIGLCWRCWPAAPYAGLSCATCAWRTLTNATANRSPWST